MKVNKEIFKGQLIQIHFSNMELEKEYLKILWIGTKKEEKITRKMAHLTTKKKVSIPTQW